MPGCGCCHRAPDNPRLYPEYHPAPGETAMRSHHGNKEFWLAALRAEGPAFGAAVAQADPGATVPSCPEWRVAGLIGHPVRLYTRAAAPLRLGRPSPPEERAPTPPRPARP